MPFWWCHIPHMTPPLLPQITGPRLATAPKLVHPGRWNCVREAELVTLLSELGGDKDLGTQGPWQPDMAMTSLVHTSWWSAKVIAESGACDPEAERRQDAFTGFAPGVTMFSRTHWLLQGVWHPRSLMATPSIYTCSHANYHNTPNYWLSEWSRTYFIFSVSALNNTGEV